MLDLGGVPLVGWTLSHALGRGGLAAVLVSTDDQRVVEYAQGCGALVPWLRPPELASDTASSVDVAIHALQWFESNHWVPDAVVLLQPTSPFRNAESIQRAMTMLGSGNRDAVVAVTPVRGHPAWGLVDVGGRILRVGLTERQLEEPSAGRPLLEPNGSLYLIRRDALLDRRSFIADGDIPMVVESPVEALDIDTSWDWFIAESVVRANLVSQPDRKFRLRSAERHG